MPFLSDLQVRPTESGRWELTAPLAYEGKTDVFFVDRGFVTDFASVPRAFWSIVSPIDPGTMRPAVLHDALYGGLASVLSKNGLDRVRRIDRYDADRIFRRTLRECGVGWLKRHVMYRAVRLFGGKRWS